jgi:hypothetical protein
MSVDLRQQLLDLVSEWKEKSVESCREFDPPVPLEPMSGLCKRCGHNGWAHAWRLASDGLSDTLVRAASPPAPQNEPLRIDLINVLEKSAWDNHAKHDSVLEDCRDEDCRYLLRLCAEVRRANIAAGGVRSAGPPQEK